MCMKLFGRFIIVILIFNSCYVLPCYAQNKVSEDDYFVIIGAFSILKNAVSFTDYVRADFNLNANFAFNENRNLHYVYVLNTADRTLAINEAMRLRNSSEFADTWVYYGNIDYENRQLHNKIQPFGNDINPETEQSISKVSDEDSAMQKSAEVLTSSSDITPTPVTKENTDERFDGKNYLFQIYRSEDSSIVDGSVDVIDVERSRKIASYKGNSVVKVSPPLSKSDSILTVCNVFGFRRMQCPLNYLKPRGNGVTVNEQGAVVVPFELHRLEKGDIAVMYNVYFYKDASIMRPESLFEINSLMSLLNENEKYVIRIHGHTNGDTYGKIVLSKSKTSNFFSLNGTIEEFGSAKKLSEGRANAIRDYLIVKGGINPNRMQVKAWGGRRPVQNKLGARAQENVRVEIEILDN